MAIGFGAVLFVVALFDSVYAQTCTQNLQCASPQLCQSNVCSCPDKTQVYQNGVCVSLTGAGCQNNMDCSLGARCVSNMCACSLGKIYNPDFVTYTYASEYPHEASSTVGACQWALGMRCTRNNVHSEHATNMVSWSSCITNHCNYTSYRCECMTSGVPDETGAKCKCSGATTYDAKQNLCKPFVNAVLDSGTNIYKCADVTKLNAKAKSCDCPIAGYQYDSESNACLCSGTSKAIDTKTKECICIGASSSPSNGGDCVPYTYYSYDYATRTYSCPEGASENKDTKSCDWNF